MSQEIVFIKLGGSIITNKEVPMMVRKSVLRQLVKEIARAKKISKKLYVVGHGSGSFAHAPALRYKTKSGFINGESLMGMAITHDSAAKLNRIVVKAFLAADLPAISFVFSSTLVTKKTKAYSWDDEVFKKYLEKGLLPVTYGDVIVDQDQGCTIWSTEMIFSYLVKWLKNQKKYQVRTIIHVNEVAGVLDRQGQVVPEISLENKDQVKEMITQTKGFDVTGGMWHKIEESLKQAESGIETKIISGLDKDNLFNALVGNKWKGTRVVSS